MSETNEGDLTAPRPSVVSAEKSTFTGVLEGPAGPLKNWPFLLKRNGIAVGKALAGGSSGNAFRDECWWSGAGGEFSFSGMPLGTYEVIVLLAGGKVVPATQEPPPAESGVRGERPAFVDLTLFREEAGSAPEE